MQTNSINTRPSDITSSWHVIDANGKTLGRLCSEIATLLQGKHKPIYVPNLISGDFVTVINAEKIRVTGNKLNDKIYYRHSGYHGGLKERKLSDVLENAPTLAIKQAVKGMLPKNTMGKRMLSRLKIHAGETHPHSAQINAGQKKSSPSKLTDNDNISQTIIPATEEKSKPKRKPKISASAKMSGVKKKPKPPSRPRKKTSATKEA